MKNDHRYSIHVVEYIQDYLEIAKYTYLHILSAYGKYGHIMT